MAKKPSLPSGTRDFSPLQMQRRNFIFDTLKSVFKKFGFLQIETPAMERLETLTGKYGEEGDRLIFKIIDSGEVLTNNQNKLYELTQGAFIRDYFVKCAEKMMNDFIEDGSEAFDNWESYLPNLWGEFPVYLNSIEKKNIRAFMQEREVQIVWKSDIEGFYSEVKFYNNLSNNELNRMKSIFIDHKVKRGWLTRYTVWRSVNTEDNENRRFNYNPLSNVISSRALRYDLTVPFARYVVQHQNEITFPFKRYQVQPVWRADRPQKGRYREFYQCDCDVIGTKSLVSEVEFVQIYDEGLSKLGLPQFEIRINNRKLLAGMVQYIDAEDKLTDFTVAIDKLDKIGKEKVGEELLQRGFSQKAVETLDFILELDGANMEKIEQLKARFEGVETAMKGLEELEYVVAQTEKLGLRKGTLVFDPALARGLDYYTGTIYEVKALNVNMGSIGGGGRYDNLTGIFGVDGISGVGISFGADRIYDVLEELDLFPQELTSGPTVLFVHFGDAERDFSLNWVTKLRNKGIFAEVYPDNAKMKKQMKYADSVGAKFVAVIGEEELQTGKITVKEMETGEQRKVKKTELINFFLDVK